MSRVLLVTQHPTETGQRVRFSGKGGGVLPWMELGTVVGFTKAGVPKILVDEVPGYGPPRTISDRYRRGDVLCADGRLVWSERLWDEDPF